LTLGDLLKMFAGVHPEPQPAGAPERSTSPPSQPHHPVEQPQPQPPKQDGANVTLTDLLDLLHGIGAQVRDAAGRSQSTHQVCFSIWMPSFELSNVSSTAECPVTSRRCTRRRASQGQSEG
jgi:hypothetical protein